MQASPVVLRYKLRVYKNQIIKIGIEYAIQLYSGIWNSSPTLNDPLHYIKSKQHPWLTGHCVCTKELTR